MLYPCFFRGVRDVADFCFVFRSGEDFEYFQWNLMFCVWNFLLMREGENYMRVVIVY